MAPDAPGGAPTGTRVLLIVKPPAPPLAVVVSVEDLMAATPDGPCADCGAGLLARPVIVVAEDAVLCAECWQIRQSGILERCRCGALVQLSEGGVRLEPGLEIVHECPLAESDTYALARELAERRDWNAEQRARRVEAQWQRRRARGPAEEPPAETVPLPLPPPVPPRARRAAGDGGVLVL